MLISEFLTNAHKQVRVDLLLHLACKVGWRDFALIGTCYTRDSKTTLYLILPKFNQGEPSLPWGSEAKPCTSSAEASGTFICPSVPGYLLFAFLTVSVWKGYFPSWMREAGVLLLQRRLEKHGGDSLIVTQCPESEQRTWKSVKGHTLPWESSQNAILCFIVSPSKVVSTTVFWIYSFHFI